jgi:hypothetical protein
LILENIAKESFTDLKIPMKIKLWQVINGAAVALERTPRED